MESTRAGSGGPLSGTLPHPARPKISLTSGTDFSQQVVFHPGHQAWNLVLLQSHSSPPPEEMAPQKGNFELQLSRSHFPSLLFPFSEVFLTSIPSILGKSEGRSFQSLEGAGRHVGSVRVASPGRPEEPQPPSCGPQELGGPRGSLENRTSPSAFLRALARGEGGRAPQRSFPHSSRPQHLCHPAAPPKKALRTKL